MKQPILFTISLLIPCSGSSAQSLDIAVAECGLSIGNSHRFTGIRINAVDRQVERINGFNLTLWNPDKNPDAAYNGIAMGLIGNKARMIYGATFGGLFAGGETSLTGLAIGAFNGLYVDRIDLADLLHLKLVNQHFTGISIGLVNYTARLEGVQIGLINYAGNIPRWLRLLPLVNLHL